MAWTALHEATTAGASLADCGLCCARFRRILVALQDGEGCCVLLRPGCGNRQGDGPAAQRYVLAQDVRLREWADGTTSA